MYTAFMVDCQLLMDFKGGRTSYNEHYGFSLYICTPEIDGRQVREPFIRKKTASGQFSDAVRISAHAVSMCRFRFIK